MTGPSAADPELLALHAVRLLGMADDGEVAERFALDPAVAAELMLDCEAVGWVTRVQFADSRGWTLTAAGQAEDERRLAAELTATGLRPTVEAAYAEFLPQNDRLLRAATDWQLRPSPTDPLAANDHTDPAWDGRVLDQLSGLGEELRRIVGTLAAGLGRFAGYDLRFAAALVRVRGGDPAWVNRPRVDSCHTVWMQLHEDLLATLGRRR